MVESNRDYVIDEPLSNRADLSEIGIEEIEPGVCEDSFENRKLLRRARLVWEPLYQTQGGLSGLIKVRSAQSTMEKRIHSLAEKRPILSNPNDNNSDYLTGLDLLAEEAADYLVPPWVVGATRKYLKEQEQGGPATEKRKPVPQPHRCRKIKEDGIRCMLWGSGRPVDDGLCRIHLRSEKSKTSDDIERARERLTQAAPYAVDQLEMLMEEAESEPVKLKAATEILDRAGVRGGYEVDGKITMDARPAGDVIQERLERLAAGAVEAAASASENEANIVDAEVVTDEEDKEKVEERPALTTNQEEDNG